MVEMTLSFQPVLPNVAGGWQKHEMPHRDPTTTAPLGRSWPEPSEGDRRTWQLWDLLSQLPSTQGPPSYLSTGTSWAAGTGELGAVQMMGSARQVSRLIAGACLAWGPLSS